MSEILLKVIQKESQKATLGEIVRTDALRDLNNADPEEAPHTDSFCSKAKHAVGMAAALAGSWARRIQRTWLGSCQVKSQVFESKLTAIYVYRS